MLMCNRFRTFELVGKSLIQITGKFTIKVLKKY